MSLGGQLGVSWDLHPDRQSLAHLLSDDLLTAVQTLPVVAGQSSSNPQQVPENTDKHKSFTDSPEHLFLLKDYAYLFK